MAAADLVPAQVFPLVVPTSEDESAYEGFISLHEASVRPSCLWLRLSGVPAAGASLAGARLQLGWELAQLLQGCDLLLTLRLAEARSVATFFLELRTLVAHRLRAQPPAPAAAPAFLTRLVDEVEQVGWHRLAALAPDLASLTLRLADPAGREVEVAVRVPAGYPAEAPSASADLPQPVALAWPPGSGLAALVDQYQDALAAAGPLWDHLDDLDQHAWVLEPERPRRSCAWRRLALGGHASLTVTLDPARPAAPPHLAFMGAEAAVAPLRQRAAASRHLWSEHRLVRGNLEAVLGQALPARQGAAAAAEDMSADCCICYAYHLPDESGSVGTGQGSVPDVNCENAKCARPFHRQCLASWLRSVADTRQSFNTLFGECPFCTAPITVKVAGV